MINISQQYPASDFLESVLTFSHWHLNGYSTFVYGILFARHLNFSTWFTKKLIFWEPKKIE